VATVGVIIVFILFGLALSLAVANYAQNKGYSFGLALLGCIVVSPLVELSCHGRGDRPM
jgi:uncharacterized membrane protein (DUF441 family)